MDSFWVPTLLDIEVDFQNSVMKRKGGKGISIIGRSSSHIYNYKINQPKDPKFFQQEVMEVMQGAESKDSPIGPKRGSRRSDKSEQLGFALVDSLRSRGVLDFYIEATRLIGWGTYKRKYWEVGPYFDVIGFNQAEGMRSRCGFYTRPDFSNWFYFGGHLAYGFGDKRLDNQASKPSSASSANPSSSSGLSARMKWSKSDSKISSTTARVCCKAVCAGFP